MKNITPKMVTRTTPKGHKEKTIRTFLWDSPEIRKAFREAKIKEDKRK